MYYRIFISDLYNRTYYNTSDLKNMAKLLAAVGLQENYLLDYGFFDSDYKEFNSYKDIEHCINERKSDLVTEDVNPTELITNIKELFEVESAQELNTKFSTSVLYVPEVGVEESTEPWPDFNDLDEFEQDEWECWPNVSGETFSF